MYYKYAARLVVLLCLLVPALAQQQQQTPRLPPAQLIRSHDYDTRDIKLDLRFDWQNERVLGKATITVAPLLANLARIEFDAGNMTVSSVKLNSGAALKYEVDAAKEKLRIALDRSYQPEDVLTLLIDYQTNAAGNAGPRGFGLVFVKPTPNDPNKPRQIWTQGQPEFSHYWFPCHDHPNDFATTEITATVEKPLIVISNGRLLETKNNPDGTRTFHWKMEQPHAAYLSSIVVGEFTPIESSYAGTPVTTYVNARDLEAGKVSAARLADMIKFMTEKTGLKYPYSKYTQVFVRDFDHIEGMENITASTIMDSLLQDARGSLDQSPEGLQVHEVVHQWFGNYISPRTWADIWLNEGFAVYMTALWDEHKLGQDDFLNRVRRNQNVYAAGWANGSRHPLANRNYGQPLDVFDINAYQGGAVVLHMLRTTLGEENWWRAVRHYLKKYANQPVQTEQFRIAIEEATGQPLDWFFDQWVYRAGFPILEVTKNYDPQTQTLTMKVRQKQKPDPASGFLQAELFRLFVDVEIGTGANTRTERIVIEPKEEQSFSFKVDSQPLLVNFDRGGAIYKGLDFQKPVDELLYQLANDRDLAGRFWAFFELLGQLRAPATNETDKRNIGAAFGDVLSKDSFWSLRVEAAKALAGVPGDVNRQRLIAATRDKDARVRAAATNTLRESKDPALADLYLQLLGDPSYLTVRTAALALAETRSPKAFDALVKLLESDSWRDTLRVSALNSLGLLGDKRALDVAMRFASENQPMAVRIAALALTASVGRNEARARSLLFDELSKSVTVNNTVLINAVAEALVNLGDPEGLKALSDAREKSGNPQVKALLSKSEERLRQSVRSTVEKPPGR